jgi:hypothetical protein
MTTQGLNVWRTDEFVEEGRSMRQVDPLRETVTWKDTQRPLAGAKAVWAKPELDVSAMALTPDAVLVAHGVGVTDRWSADAEELAQRVPLITYEGWELTAFGRESGEELWKVELPIEPLYNGIAVAGDGAVLVTFRDGNIACIRSEK